MLPINMELKREEKAIFYLRSLFEQHGYSQFKMNKFEEYDLYVRNKDFLISDGIITFTDTNGKLLALKPDVTLSIIKNFRHTPGVCSKLYYNENVYRVSSGTHSFKELMQVGVECMGEVDEYALYEMLSLAAKSLLVLSQDAVLDISDFSTVSLLLDEFGLDADIKKQVLAAIGEKNAHELLALCKKIGLSADKISVLTELVALYGEPHEVFSRAVTLLSPYVKTGNLSRLERICSRLAENGLGNMIRIDFSVVNGADYYNGIVFRGYIKGVPTWILSGGQYDRLMQKMNHQAGAVGFAVYLDLLEELEDCGKPYDVDAVLIYNDNDSISDVDKALQSLISEGKTAVAQKNIPEEVRYRELWNLTEQGGKQIERNA